MLWYWLIFSLGVGSSTGQASTSVCRHLQGHAYRLYRQAVRLTPQQAAMQVVCRKRSLAYQAITLYRAYLVSRCRDRVQAYLHLGQLLQACTSQKESACRFYGQYLRRCGKDRRCRRSRFFRQRTLQKILPFAIREAFTDRDKDRYRSCHRTMIRCTKQGTVVVEPQTGRVNKKLCDCDDGDPNVRPGGRELCDGKDNDCDGQIDESEELVAPPCDNQQGVCRGARKQCGGVRGWLPCDTVVYTRNNKYYERQETACDGLDNDCDGKIDNNLKAPRCGMQRGVCRGARKACRGAQGWQDCVPSDYRHHNASYEEQEQRCDGKDNDCNGKVDDIASPPPCTLQQGVCAGARQTCRGKRGWQDCSVSQLRRHNSAYQRKETACDGKDNDCDGRVDSHCIPTYPWIIAGVGATLLGLGIIVRSVAVHAPEDVALQTIANRPSVGGVRGWLTFADTGIVLGSLAAATGLGLGLAFVIRALTPPRTPPKLRPQIKPGASIPPPPVCWPTCNTSQYFYTTAGE